MTVLLWGSLTPAQQVALVEGRQVFYDAGCDVLDSDDVFITSLNDEESSDFIAAGSSVDRGIYRTLHGSARLRISRELLWGSQRLRPYHLISADGVTFYRRNLGVFLPSTPEKALGETPAVFEVECFDKLDVLNQPHGASYSLAAGELVIAAMEALITAAGESKFIINQTSAAVTAPADKLFPLSDESTTLEIVNALAASIGYRALFADREGFYRSRPYVSPENLPRVWTYNANGDRSTVSEQRTSVADYYGAANKIIGYNDDISNDVPTIANGGIVELSNVADGPTSIAARGRTIPRILRGTYASTEALTTAVQAALDVEKRVANFVELKVAPSAVHGHFDAVRYMDSEIPVDGSFVVTAWSLPLDGSDMSLSLRGV